MSIKIKIDIDIAKEVKRASRSLFRTKPTTVFRDKRKNKKEKHKKDYSEEI